VSLAWLMPIKAKAVVTLKANKKLIAFLPLIAVASIWLIIVFYVCETFSLFI
jgi:hypothetical protein